MCVCVCRERERERVWSIYSSAPALILLLLILLLIFFWFCWGSGYIFINTYTRVTTTHFTTHITCTHSAHKPAAMHTYIHMQTYVYIHHGWKRSQGKFTTTGRSFTTAEKEILENCRCIVPNFMNDEFISIVPTWGVLPLLFSTGPSKLFKFPEIVRPFPSMGG